MIRPFDTTLKDLIEIAPADWVAFFGHPVDPAIVSVIDSDLATVATAADKVIRVADDSPWILHLEFQTSHDTLLPRRLLRYNALLQYQHECSVATVLILLRPEANGTNLTGELALTPPIGMPTLFRYTVLRVWERPPDDFLAGGIATLPLATISATTAADMPGVFARMRDRLKADADPPLTDRLWSASYILMGLRHPQALIDRLMQEVHAMEDSVTYQYLVNKGLAMGEARGLEKGRAEGEAKGLAVGKVEEAREMLLRIGTKRFGPPSPSTAAAIEAIRERKQIELYVDRALDAATWDDVFAP